MHAAPQDPLLVVQPAPEAPPGWVGQWLTEGGVTLDVRHPYAGDALPDDLTGHCGLLVLGGDMGANDDDQYPWLAPTKALVREAAEQRRPALGICLGHQIVAVALGGTAAVNPAGERVGLQRVGWLPEAAADPLGSVSGVTCAQWNGDVVTVLPPGAVALARNGFGELQAARFAPTVWGVQWHPEVGAEICRPWAAQAAKDHPDKAAAYAVAIADLADAEAALQAAWRPMTRAFAAQLGPGSDSRANHP